jgi:hypothetical protein
MLVAASSNSVANQGTAAVASATRAMDRMKATTFDNLDNEEGGTDFAVDDALDCTDPTLALGDWHCSETVPGVGLIHTHWWVTFTDDPRLLHPVLRRLGAWRHPRAGFCISLLHQRRGRMPGPVMRRLKGSASSADGRRDVTSP